jgi:hypothetical protein
VTITGDPNRVQVALGVGKWLQNLGFATVEGLFLTPILWFVEIPMGFWGFEIEKKFWTYLDQQVELGL